MKCPLPRQARSVIVNPLQIRPFPTIRMGTGNLKFAGTRIQDGRFKGLLRVRDSLRVAVTVKAVRDVNRLLEGSDPHECDRRRKMERENGENMLMARRSVM